MPGTDALGIARELQAYAERELLPAMRAVYPDCAIETTTLGILPPFSSGEGSEATHAGAEARRPERDLRRALWHRGQPFPGRRLLDRR